MQSARDEEGTNTAPLAIIGGNALAALSELNISHRRVERTPYGEPSAPLLLGTLFDKPIVFLARHGASATLGPDEINDFANIDALQQNKVRAIIGISSAVSLSDELNEGTFILPDQLIEMNASRTCRFPRPANTPYHPLHFSEPFDMTWHEHVLQKAPKDVKVYRGGTYVSTSGFRSETRAEAHFYRTVGGLAMGATGAQEAALARDIGIPYVLLLVVTRKATKRFEESNKINMGDIALTLSRWLGDL